jgi:type IV secretion system protein VirB1
MILSLAMFAQLAASCGPTVHVDTLAAVARTESAFNTLAIGDNTARQSYAPATLEEAVATATALLAQGHSLDLGLMQVNSANLPGVRMSVGDAFDPCKSISAGARVLADGYRAPAIGEDVQPALLQALSHYNTGSPSRGFANGYVRRVQASAEQVVPAIRLGGTAAVATEPKAGAPAASPTNPAPPTPPSWDVFGNAWQARARGRVLFGAPAAAKPVAPTQPAPAQLRATTRVASDAG